MSELTKALIQFHKDVGVIKKDARAQYGKFADLCGVLSTVTPALLKNNLVLTQEFIEDSLVTTLRHTSGETITSTSKLVIQPGKNALHSWGASVTYTRRYQICCCLSLVADLDMDGAIDGKAEAEPTYKPAPAQKDKQASAPAPAPTPAPSKSLEDMPLDPEAYNMVMAVLKEIYAKDPAKVMRITEAFRKRFKTSETVALSQSMTNQAHVAFVNELL